ncbi:MAG TPA: hypothetical protein VNX66_05615 [Candidatus Sulfotelmatobacter sp.]|jgi:hypothetical protein|nr:hypothetical protein [Candidatus Sulfotelmatobacter sp.]
MPNPTPAGLRPIRAIATFLLGYIAVTILAIALSVALEQITHPPPAKEMVRSESYVLSEKFYPLINVLVWTALSWGYFSIRRNSTNLFKEALSLGSMWLILAMLVDYVGFVLIKNPISLGAHDFYIGQFPWIYLIYLAIFVSPLLYVLLRRKSQAVAA